MSCVLGSLQVAHTCAGTVACKKTGFSSSLARSGARAGLSCGLAEAQGPKTSELMAPDTSGLENSKTCSACGKIKSRVDFGKKQWAARAVRRCVACVESGVKVVFCDHGRGRDCAVCDAAAAASAAAAATAHLDELARAEQARLDELAKPEEARLEKIRGRPERARLRRRCDVCLVAVPRSRRDRPSAYRHRRSSGSPSN